MGKQPNRTWQKAAVKREAAVLENLYLDDPDGFIKMVGKTGHGKEQHISVSLADCLDRLLTEQRAKVSRFYNERAWTEAWVDVVLDSKEDIAYWHQNQPGCWKKEFPLSQSGVLPSDPVVGEGLVVKDGAIVHVKTRAVKVILARSDENILGFETKTAYPDLSDSVAVQTGKDLRPVMRQTKSYRMAGKTKRKQLLAMVSPKPDRAFARAVAELGTEPVMDMR